jgi:hypothetical protein
MWIRDADGRRTIAPRTHCFSLGAPGNLQAGTGRVAWGMGDGYCANEQVFDDPVHATPPSGTPESLRL